MDLRYDLVFCGEALDPFSPEQVKKNIASHFRKDVAKLDRFFTGEAITLARDLAPDRAERLSRQLESLGAQVYLQARGESDAKVEPAPPVVSTASPTAGQSEVEQSPAQEGTEPSRRHRWRYAFDTFMAKGGSSIFKALTLCFLSSLLLIGLARGVFQWMAPDAALQYGELDFWGNLYVTFLQLTDPGNMAQDILSSARYKAFSVVAGLSGAILLSALVAFITTGLDQKISELKRGRSKVIESGHTLILGWSEQRIVEIVRELILANESESDACVVILADKDKEEMDDILRLRLPDTKTTRLVTRSGSVSTLANLDMVSIETCRSAIILALCDDTASAGEKAGSDAMVIQSILAASGRSAVDDDFTVVAEIYNPAHRDVVEKTFPDHIVTVNTSEILAKLLVQTSRSVGLSVVYNEILSFDGCEMYFHEDDWGDVAFADLACRFPDGVPMGVRQGDGVLLLNPPRDYRMRSDDDILIVADDDSTIELRSQPVATPRAMTPSGGRLSQKVERELVLGWNQKAATIMREFADYVQPGSEAHVVLKAPTESEREAIEAVNAELESLTVALVTADVLDRDMLMALRPFEYDNIIILAGGGEDEVDVAQVDSENIVALLLLRSIFNEHPEQSRSTKLITEVLDSQNHPLVARAGVKDVIISNRLVSMIIAQISESRDIKRVYDDIFQEDGSEIYLKPASLYFEHFPVEVSFADLIGIAGHREEVCIGVKRKVLEGDDAHNNGVELIPEKNQRFVLEEEDCLIVLAEDEL